MIAFTVHYNTPGLVKGMIDSFRKFYDIKFVIIDGSDAQHYEKLKTLDFVNVEIIHFDFNIHHGPGMAYAFTHLDSDKMLVLDTDVFIHQRFLEILESRLQRWQYGAGDIQTVNRDGWNVASGIRYLHPACMLVNRDVVLKWPMPKLHGAPMIDTMTAIHERERDGLLVYVPEVDTKIHNGMYIEHHYQGTVKRTHGYHLL